MVGEMGTKISREADGQSFERGVKIYLERMVGCLKDMGTSIPGETDSRIGEIAGRWILDTWRD